MPRKGLRKEVGRMPKQKGRKNGTPQNGTHLEELKRWYDSLPEKEKE